VLPLSGQNISKGEAALVINANGDSLIVMHLEDSRLALTDVLGYEIADSLITEYEVKDSLNSSLTSIHLETIRTLQAEIKATDTQKDILQKIIDNKDSEIVIKDATIKAQKKEIRKQKFQKIVAIAAAVVLPILVLMAK